ncbi:MAG: hypothetical protein AAF581_19545 [Planctomycetota bacterium]
MLSSSVRSVVVAYGCVILCGWASATFAAPQEAVTGGAVTAAARPDQAEAKTAASLQGLRIRQETRGIPGRVGDGQQRIAQVIRVTKDRLRLDDPEAGSRLLLRLDGPEPRFYEVTADGSEYRQGKDLDKIQQDRDRLEKQQLAGILQEPRAKQDQMLAEAFLRRDGKREVAVTEKVADDKVLGHTCKRFIVRENGRIIVDVYTTEDFGVEIPFFDYYRRVGAFSDEVLKALQGIRGVPLKADFSVITAGLNYDLSVVATSAAVRPFEPSIFELPEGAKEIVESTTAPCGECSKLVEKAAPPGRLVINSEPIYFCCKDCRKAFQKRRYQQGPGGASPKPERPSPKAGNGGGK